MYVWKKREGDILNSVQLLFDRVLNLEPSFNLLGFYILLNVVCTDQFRIKYLGKGIK